MKMTLNLLKSRQILLRELMGPMCSGVGGRLRGRKLVENKSFMFNH